MSNDKFVFTFPKTIYKLFLHINYLLISITSGLHYKIVYYVLLNALYRLLKDTDNYENVPDDILYDDSVKFYWEFCLYISILNADV